MSALSEAFVPALLGALVGGAGVAWMLGAFEDSPGGRASPESVVARSPNADTVLEIARLREELAQERALRVAPPAPPSAEPASPGLPAAEPPAEKDFPEMTGAEAEEEVAETRPWFDSAALGRLGWSEDEVERVRQRWEEYQLAKLEVENQRARKVPGWKALGKRLFQIEVEARNDLGDEGYEAMRFAAGQKNRVVLSELLDISPASDGGLMPGDEVISYDGQRVFSSGALKFLTQSGEPDAWTEVRVLRAGEERRFFVRRGPLGARLEAVRRPPYP